MIAVDTSALIEIAMGAPEAERCQLAMAKADRMLVSAGTVHEALVVGGRRGIADLVDELLRDRRIEVVVLDEAFARQAAETYAVYGKGLHPAGLNLGDCYSYALAKSRELPLLYVGDDFARTDIESALA